jgi:hypothetical protein
MFAVDPLAQQLGMGGTFGIGLSWLLLKYKPWKNGNNATRAPSNCPFISEQAGELRLLQIGKIVTESIAPVLQRQTSHMERLAEEAIKQTAALREIENILLGRRTVL